MTNMSFIPQFGTELQ